MSEHVKKVSEAEFDGVIKSGTTLVDFYADWCGPCKMMAPQLDIVAKDVPQANVIKVDVDHAQQVASKYGVTSIPTLVLFKNGKEVNRMVGARRAQEIKDFILTS